MTNQLDQKAFIARIKAKRGDMGLREAAAEIGEISASSLSRIENGKLPDMETFLRICDWLEVDSSTFLTLASDAEFESEGNTPQIIEAHLRADTNLDEDTAIAIAKMVKNVYEMNAKKNNHA